MVIGDRREGCQGNRNERGKCSAREFSAVNGGRHAWGSAREVEGKVVRFSGPEKYRLT